MFLSLHRAAAHAAATIALAAAVVPSATHGAQRTFVSSTGNDANACTLGAPCRSFGTALTHTDPDGEIIVLDSAGYGRVTIGQSVSIIAPSGVYAGVSVFSATNGVDIAGANVVVVLRGLAINGQGGDIGIRFTQGSRLYVEQCTVSNMGGHGISLETGQTYVTDSTSRDNTGSGISVQAGILAVDRARIERNGNAGLRVFNAPAVNVANSIIAGNTGIGGSGIDIDVNDGTTESAVTVANSSLALNSAGGISATATGAGSIARLAVARSTISRNGSAGIVMSATTGTLTAIVTDNTIARNSGAGVRAQGAGVSATVATNGISANLTGLLQFSNALLKTRSNNVVQDNTTDIFGTLTFVAGD